jgi:hypothetical protein
MSCVRGLWRATQEFRAGLLRIAGAMLSLGSIEPTLLEVLFGNSRLTSSIRFPLAAGTDRSMLKAWHLEWPPGQVRCYEKDGR